MEVAVRVHYVAALLKAVCMRIMELWDLPIRSQKFLGICFHRRIHFVHRIHSISAMQNMKNWGPNSKKWLCYALRRHM